MKWVAKDRDAPMPFAVAKVPEAHKRNRGVRVASRLGGLGKHGSTAHCGLERIPCYPQEVAPRCKRPSQ